MLSLWAVFALLLIYWLTKAGGEHWVSLGIIIASIILASIVLIKNAIALYIANDNIFPYSGMPVQMLNKLYEALALSSQAIIALIFVTVIGVLIAEGKVESQAGLPILSAVIGYTVAKEVSKEELKKDG